MYDVIEVARFWSNVVIAENHECWEWQGSFRGTPVNGKRYGGFKSMNASRYVAGLSRDKPLEQGEVACHHCDNPPCVNPKHIYVGSYADNSLDVVIRDRHPHATKTHCKHGHAYTGDNLFIRKNGHRECRLCMAASSKKARAKAKGNNHD